MSRLRSASGIFENQAVTPTDPVEHALLRLLIVISLHGGFRK